MGLINLTTSLKGLGFGKDRKGGGDSGQPYVKKDIPSKSDELDNALRYGTGGPDMFLRGGLLTPLRVANDLERWGKFFIDTKSPRGLLFVAQQNLLSRLAVKTEASYGVGYGTGQKAGTTNIVATGPVNEGIYLPTSTLLQIAGNPFGLHLNKQGIDPTGLTEASIRNYSSLFFNQGEPTQTLGENRLYKLLQGKILDNIDDSNILYSYGGGPGSILGIGKTRIRLISPEQRTGRNNINGKKIIDIKDPSTGLLTPDGKGNYLSGLAYSLTDRSDIIFNGNTLLGASDAYSVETEINDVLIKEPLNNDFNFPEGQQAPGRYYGPQDDNSTLSIDDKNLNLNIYQADFQLNTSKLSEFREEKKAKYTGIYSDDTLRKSYSKYLESLESSINGVGLSVQTYDIGGYDSSLGGTPTENVTLMGQNLVVGPQSGDADTDLGQASSGKNPLSLRTIEIVSERPKAGDRKSYLRDIFRNLEADNYYATTETFKENPDIIDFCISFFEGVNQKLFFYFPAYIESFDDGFTADWKSEKFMGRGENFYTYNGFDRSISLSFKTYARNLSVMPLMYSNLNTIASSLAPKYNSGGFMTGNLSKLTLGEYIKDLPGVITSFKFSKVVSDEASWDADAQLPYIFNVSMDFKPIHNFLPKFGTTFFGGDYNFDEHPMALRLQRLQDQENPITSIEPNSISIPTSPLPPFTPLG